MAYQKMFFENAHKVIQILNEKRKDFVIDSLAGIDACVSNLNLDVTAFKNIRNRLFIQI